MESYDSLGRAQCLSLYNNSATCAASYLLFTERYIVWQAERKRRRLTKGIHSVLVTLLKFRVFMLDGFNRSLPNRSP